MATQLLGMRSRPRLIYHRQEVSYNASTGYYSGALAYNDRSELLHSQTGFGLAFIACIITVQRVLDELWMIYASVYAQCSVTANIRVVIMIAIHFSQVPSMKFYLLNVAQPRIPATQHTVRQYHGRH